MKKVLIVALTAMLASSASAALLLYEGFDYTAGEDTLTNSANVGGTGWTGGWSSNTSRGVADVASGSLSYGTLQTTGNSAGIDIGLDTRKGTYDFDSVIRNLGGVINSTANYWVSYLINLDPANVPVNGTSVGVTFGTVFFGRCDNDKTLPPSFTDQWQVGDVMTPTTVTTGTHLVVGKFGTDGDLWTQYIWIDPSTSSLGGLDLTTASANGFYALGDTDTLASVVIGGPNASVIDEIRVGESYADVTPIPEPASILLLVSGLVGAYKLRRRS